MDIIVRCPSCGGHNSLTIADEAQAVVCGTCDVLIFEYQRVPENAGFVYVLSNPSFDGLVKVGCTRRSVVERVSDLNSQTGVPGAFVVEAHFYVEDRFRAEAQAHDALRDSRVRGKEFFRMSPQEAISVLEEAFGVAPIYTRAGDEQRPAPSGHREDKDAQYTGGQRAARLAAWQARRLRK